MERLGVGVLGAGGIARHHGQGWASFPERAALVAVADVSEPRAAAFADRFAAGAARRYASIDELLADPEVQAVDICLPHHLHAGAIVAAARAGKASLCEKPLGTTMADAAEIAAVLRDAGVPFMMAHNQRFQPSAIEARRLLAEGALGDVYLVRSIEASQQRGPTTGELPPDLAAGESPWVWRGDPNRMGGGELLDTGWHGVYRLLALVGPDERPIDVSAALARCLHRGLAAEDTGLVVVRFASGLVGEVLTSWAFAMPGDRQFEIAGELGSLAGSETGITHQLHGWPATERPLAPVHTFTDEIGHFLDVVQRGARCLAPFAEGARALQIIRAAYRSAADGRVIPLPVDPLVDPDDLVVRSGVA
ncbi:MAG: Gfo/Idh/MocA family oxidoreductase [Thermomicrobiales bacterium]|nr:Gfo/Idh/MocA family oxidoreductase [Thermomicrobiales bacterium]